MKYFIFSLIVLLMMVIYSSAGIINVPGDQPTIQAGIDAATNGDTVLVDDGTYTENISFKGKAITVASHYWVDGDTNHIHNTIIDGSQPSNPDSGSVVRFMSGEDTTSVLCGFTITGGSGTLAGGGVARAGGGINVGGGSGARIRYNYIVNNSLTSNLPCVGGGISTGPLLPPSFIIIEYNTISHNTITSNVAGVDGGGIKLTIPGKIIGNKITHNVITSAASWSQGGGFGCASPVGHAVVIKGNVIAHNKSEGNGPDALAGGFYLVNYHSIVDSNSIMYNEVVAPPSVLAAAAGVHLESITDSSVFQRNIISHNTFTGGEFRAGGINIIDCRPLVQNNIIVYNKATQGGGIHTRVGNHHPKLINNTIVNNEATQGGGIFNRDFHTHLMNNILWGNIASSGSQIYVFSGSIDVAYSDVQGGWPGDGNIDADPLLVADSLSNASPCIGAGTLQYDFGGGVVLNSPPYDINGRMRPYPAGSNPDMGAWESKLDTAVVGIEPQPFAGIPTSYALHQNYPNPFNPETNIGFGIADFGFVSLKVYDITGREVATLISENLMPGNYEYSWNAKGLASGVYFYRIEAGNFTKTRKMLLIR